MLLHCLWGNVKGVIHHSTWSPLQKQPQKRSCSLTWAKLILSYMCKMDAFLSNGRCVSLFRLLEDIELGPPLGFRTCMWLSDVCLWKKLITDFFVLSTPTFIFLCPQVSIPFSLPDSISISSSLPPPPPLLVSLSLSPLCMSVSLSLLPFSLPVSPLPASLPISLLSFTNTHTEYFPFVSSFYGTHFYKAC